MDTGTGEANHPFVETVSPNWRRQSQLFAQTTSRFRSDVELDTNAELLREAVQRDTWCVPPASPVTHSDPGTTAHFAPSIGHADPHAPGASKGDSKHTYGAVAEWAFACRKRDIAWPLSSGPDCRCAPARHLTLTNYRFQPILEGCLGKLSV
jgi:hypothetical protein